MAFVCLSFVITLQRYLYCELPQCSYQVNATYVDLYYTPFTCAPNRVEPRLVNLGATQVSGSM